MPLGAPELVVDVEVAARGRMPWSLWFPQGLLFWVRPSGSSGESVFGVGVAPIVPPQMTWT